MDGHLKYKYNFIGVGLLFTFFFLSLKSYGQNVDLSGYELSRPKKLKLSYHTFKKVAKLDFRGYSFYFDFDNFVEFLTPTHFQGDTTLIFKLRHAPSGLDTIYLNPYLTTDRMIEFTSNDAGRRILDKCVNIQKIGSLEFEKYLTIRHYKTKNKTGCAFTGNFYFSRDNILLFDQFLTQSMLRSY